MNKVVPNSLLKVWIFLQKRTAIYFVAGSYADTDSSSDKKREKTDSPSTLMDQLRKDYNKDVYRFSADYDDMPYKVTPSFHLVLCFLQI